MVNTISFQSYQFGLDVYDVSIKELCLAMGWVDLVRSRYLRGGDFSSLLVSRLNLGSTEPPVNGVQGAFPGDKGGQA